jgi:hypothetical protein
MLMSLYAYVFTHVSRLTIHDSRLTIHEEQGKQEKTFSKSAMPTEGKAIRDNARKAFMGS